MKSARARASASSVVVSRESVENRSRARLVFIRVSRVVADDARERWDAWQRATLAPLWETIGAEVQPHDDDRRRALRGVVLALLGGAGDPSVLETSRAVFDRTMGDAASVDPGIASGALQVVAAHADDEQFDRILDRFRNGPTPQDQMRHLYAAARVQDVSLFDRYLGLVDSDEVRSQNLAFAVRAALRNRVHGARAWSFVDANWDRLIERLPFNSVHRMVEGIETQTDRATADAIESFLGDRPVPHAAKAIAQHRERMWVSVTLAERERDRLVAALG